MLPAIYLLLNMFRYLFLENKTSKNNSIHCIRVFVFLSNKSINTPLKKDTVCLLSSKIKTKQIVLKRINLEKRRVFCRDSLADVSLVISASLTKLCYTFFYYNQCIVAVETMSWKLFLWLVKDTNQNVNTNVVHIRCELFILLYIHYWQTAANKGMPIFLCTLVNLRTSDDVTILFW